MSDIKCSRAMFRYWNEELEKNGLKKIYIVEFISSKNREVSYEETDSVVEFEPLYTTFFDISKINLFKRYLCKKTKRIDFQDYNNLWNCILKRRRTYDGLPIQKGCFVGWDNSARKGYDCMIVRGSSPEAFYRNFKKLLSINRQDSSNDFIVINAWNEWSEGAVLEPTKKYGYGYLESIKAAKGKLLS